MTKTKPLFFVYAFSLMLCITFILGTAQNLPPVVASHFNLSGKPDASMSRDQFTNLFLAIMVLTSGLMALLPMLIAKLPPQMINIPNRMYWLSPDRIDETKQILQAYLLILASKLCCFMAVIFWLIVQAHLHNPPQLSTHHLMVATGVFVLMTIFWSLRLSARFKKV
jgi:uncharacterized membrane protein